MHKIYKLIDPNTLQVRYVGYTSKKLYERLSGHIGNITSHGKRPRNKHQLWICSLLKDNQIPLIKLIKKVSIHDWEKWEIHYISKYKKLGFDLTNNTDGGIGSNGFIMTMENRKQLSKRLTGKGNPSAKPIKGINLENGNELRFDCAADAARFLNEQGINISRSNIRDCIRGHKHKGKIFMRKQAGGYSWEEINLKTKTNGKT